MYMIWDFRIHFQESGKGSFYYYAKQERKMHLLLDYTYYLNFFFNIFYTEV